MSVPPILLKLFGDELLGWPENAAGPAEEARLVREVRENEVKSAQSKHDRECKKRAKIIIK